MRFHDVFLVFVVFEICFRTWAMIFGVSTRVWSAILSATAPLKLTNISRPVE
jgi:hypothetical protein